jgi:hypothetical protein
MALAMLASTGGVAHAQDTDACIAANEKAVALQKKGQLVQARAALSTCAASSCPDAVSSSCRQRLVALGETIPSVVFFAADASGHDLVAVRVTVDGAPYADHLDGRAIVLDPGEHEFRFEAAGQAPVVRRLVLHQGEKNRREDVVIGLPGAPGPAATPAPAIARVAAPGSGQETATRGAVQRTTGLVVGGVGVAGVVAGGVFGALSMSAHGSYEASCGSSIGAPAGRCNASGVTGESDAASKGTASTILFIGGGLATAAGLVLYLTAPSGVATPEVAVVPGGVVVAGRF